jgi:hypothetical protein
MKLEITHNQAMQFLASVDANHFNIKVFDDIKDQITSQLAKPAAEEAPAAAVAAFMAGVPHEQFDEDAEEAEEK